MKSIKNLSTLSIPFFFLMANAPTVHAVSSFGSSSTLTYAINSIVNMDNPGDLSGLTINGIFELDDSQTYTEYTGNGTSSISHSGWYYGPVEGNVFSKTFSLSGSVGNGDVTSNYLFFFDLEFINGSNDRFEIDVDFAYSLSVNTIGEEVFNEIYLDYGELLTNQYFFEEISSFETGGDQLTGSHKFLFTLGAFEEQLILADVNHFGTVSAVPVPAAIWLFGSALFGLVANGLRKRANC
ncbi:MAG: hypothetical protein CVV06_12115 [Gammaproteobacteria bacterium HGW-Gammaproteobacteria-10]|nr:MAG: hypothetical protein CVV06_12115 [Gammaproteobacteria bacterium HGW-Gammaproteobacteria-10]